MGENYVLQKWMGEIPLKQQSVLLSSLRGPDNAYLPNIKKVTKWIRSIAQKNADPSREYMRTETLPKFEELERELNFCTVHYAVHLMWALEIIGYGHPDKKLAIIASDYYKELSTQLFYLQPETRKQLNKRLEDRI